MKLLEKTDVSRRGFFHRMGTGAVAVAAAGTVLGGLTRAANADVNALVAEKMGEGTIADSDKITLDIKGKAENGALVRMPITVDLPMEADNYVASVGVFVDNNPKPFVAQMNFKPELGVVKFEIRVKMAKPSPVRIVARTNGGQLFQLVQSVDVAEGGCSG